MDPSTWHGLDSGPYHGLPEETFFLVAVFLIVILPTPRSEVDGESLIAFPTKEEEERAIDEAAIVVFYWQLSQTNE
jgi:hypothetical protein